MSEFVLGFKELVERLGLPLEPLEDEIRVIIPDSTGVFARKGAIQRAKLNDTIVLLEWRDGEEARLLVPYILNDPPHLTADELYALTYRTALGIGIDATYFARQMALESCNFRDDVVYGPTVGGVGEEGIAQLHPDFYPEVDAFNPYEALNKAAQIMKGYLDASGDWAEAIACYNWGAGNVRKSWDKWGTAWWIELPDSTLNYIKRVLKGD